MRRRRTMANEMCMSRQPMGGSSEMMSSNAHGGHLYMQTNEIRNLIVHYRRSANGTLPEGERIATGGGRPGAHKNRHRPGGGPHPPSRRGWRLPPPARQHPFVPQRWGE